MKQTDEPETEVTQSLKGPGEYIHVIVEHVDSMKSAKNRVFLEVQQDLQAGGEEAVQASERALCIAYNLEKGWDYLIETGSLDGFVPRTTLRREEEKKVKESEASPEDL